LRVRLPPLPLVGVGLVEAWPSQVRQRVASAQAGDRPQVRILLPPFNRSGVVERQDARLLIAKRRFKSCRRSCLAPVVELAMTPGPQPGSCGFKSRRGSLHLAVGEKATPPASGAGDRRFDSCRPDLDLKRGRGAAVLASLMSSRPWVRIPPAPSPRGRSSAARATGCQPVDRRFESGRPRSMVVVV
jgi:hypothetical protein